MNRKAALLVILVFVLGLALGALGMHLATSRIWAGPPRPKDPARVVHELTRELGLTPDQQKQLSAIVEETRAKYHAIYEECRPRMDEARQQGRQKIRGILTPEQLVKFEARLQRLDEERKARGGH